MFSLAHQLFWRSLKILEMVIKLQCHLLRTHVNSYHFVKYLQGPSITNVLGVFDMLLPERNVENCSHKIGKFRFARSVKATMPAFFLKEQRFVPINR